MADEGLTALVERLEAATADRQREMLWQAWQLLRGSTFAPTDADTAAIMVDGAYAAFVCKLDAEAYVDAALTLVPEGWAHLSGDYLGKANPVKWRGRTQYSKGWASLTADDDAMTNIRTNAETQALAICAAALKARAKLEQSI